MSTYTTEGHAQAADIAAALRSLKPNRQHHNSQLFAILYPVIVEMLDHKVTQKAILKTLDEHGLKLHPARFKELMANARSGTGSSCEAAVVTGDATSSTAEDAP